VTTNAALRSGQIDFGTLRDYVELQDLISTNPEFVVQVMAPNSTYSPYPWLLQLRDPLFQDIRVRRGLSVALNRRQMIDSLTGGLGAGGHTISWNFLGLSDPLDPEELGPWQQYNPTMAKQFLTEAGYPNGFEMEFMVSGAPSNRDIMMQQQLAEVGVRVVFNQVESVVRTNARLNGTFKHAVDNTSSTAYDPVKIASERFLPNSGKNWGGVNDPEMTALVEKATYTLDADEQSRLIKQIHERSLDQAYQLETYTAFVEFVRQPWLHNGASAVQGYFNVFGYHQAAVLWVDDSAPGDRRGRLKA
jgi:ABC-type transport system substrate-binding protein